MDFPNGASQDCQSKPRVPATDGNVLSVKTSGFEKAGARGFFGRAGRMTAVSRGNRGLHRCSIAWMVLRLVLAAGWTAAANASGLQPRSTPPKWSEAQPDGLAVELVQRPIDLTEAFFQGRGFAPAASRQIADACVMAVVVKNRSSSGTIRFNLADWRVITNGHEQPLRLEADWRKEWGKERISRPAQIAFRYALLPTVDRLGPGDWLQGMITANLGAGRHFDLRIRWTDNGVPKQATVRRVLCSAAHPSMGKLP